MVRRRKQDVLKELPAKRKQVVKISGAFELLKKLREEEEVLFGYDEHTNAFKDCVCAQAFKLRSHSHNEAQRDKEHVRRVTHCMQEARERAAKTTAAAKCEGVCEYVRDAINAGIGKFLLFAHHQHLMDRLEDCIENYR
eukprot:3617721-Amphidinium_carterae.1